MGGMGGRWEGGPRGRDISIHIADSLHCTAETNTTLKSNYTSIKKNTANVLFLKLSMGTYFFILLFLFVKYVHIYTLSYMYEVNQNNMFLSFSKPLISLHAYILWYNVLKYKIAWLRKQHPDTHIHTHTHKCNSMLKKKTNKNQKPSL